MNTSPAPQFYQFPAVSKVLFYICVASSLYIGLLLLDYYVVKSTFVLVGVFRELLTIPVFFGQFACVFVALFYWVRAGFSLRSYALWAFLISLANSLFILISYLK